MKPIAFVIPWYGEDLKGGAEQFAWQFSHRLASRGHGVEVLTTCCASFLEDWNENHLDRGESRTDGNVLVRRFEVDKRDAQAFHSANMRLLDVSRQALEAPGYRVASADAGIFADQNIRSDALNSFIAGHADSYHAFVFIPYMYGTTFDSLSLVAEKAFLHPCLHDEIYARLPQVEKLFRQCAGLLYNSQGERYIAEKLYGPGIHNKGVVVGGGVEVAPHECATLPDSVGGVRLSSSRYVLCLGRRDGTKNTDFLVRAFKRYKMLDASSDVRLYLAGPGTHNYTDEAAGVLDYGLVSEQEKNALLWHSLALLQPSSNESYSRTLMEGWLYGKPVAVHRDCLATAEPVEQSGGGWMAGDEDDWVSMLTELAAAPSETLDVMGRKGREFASELASWDRAMDRYQSALKLSVDDVLQRAPQIDSLGRIVQCTAGITYGDAISNQTMFIRDYLRESGYESDIIVEVLDPLCAGEAEVYRDGVLDGADAVIYHHSIGTSLTSSCANFSGPKGLIYHNITPAAFYWPYDNHIAELLENGRRDLPAIVGSFPTIVGDSAYNALEIQALGALDTEVLPIAVDPGLWKDPACEKVAERIGDGKRNILFVGRISPNKGQQDLVQAFNHYRVLDPGSRLILVGGYDPDDSYYLQLQRTVEALGIGGDVLLPGKVSQGELQAYYRGSHLFWSMSEHEGFGVPLVESMWFELPVMAFKSSAVPETLGEGGIVFDNKDNYTELAFLAERLMQDRRLRTDIIAGQRNRRMRFHPDRIKRSVDALISGLGRQLGGGKA